MRRSTRALSNLVVKDAYTGALVTELPLDTAATGEATIAPSEH